MPSEDTRAPAERTIAFSAFGGGPLVLIAGPCVIESEEHVHRMARGIRNAVGKFVFKASFDKANRTSAARTGDRL